eukprot:3183014-Pleurochrysis_carterae.AAC.1
MVLIKGEERRSREARAGARQHQEDNLCVVCKAVISHGSISEFYVAVPCKKPDTYTQTVKAVTVRIRSTVFNARLGGTNVRARFINDACARAREREGIE